MSPSHVIVSRAPPHRLHWARGAVYTTCMYVGPAVWGGVYLTGPLHILFQRRCWEGTEQAPRALHKGGCALLGNATTTFSFSLNHLCIHPAHPFETAKPSSCTTRECSAMPPPDPRHHPSTNQSRQVPSPFSYVCFSVKIFCVCCRRQA